MKGNLVKTMIASCLFFTAQLLLPAKCHAQYSIDWFTVAGGGGSSTGGLYALDGVIGQPDAGTLRGGGYELTGGFWGFVDLVQTPGAPSLTIERQAGAVRIAWARPATGFVLDQSSSPAGAWTQAPFPYVTNALEISLTLTGPVGTRFYRLRRL